MTHIFEHGQVPVICDLEKAQQTKIEIDENIENKIREEREQWIKAGNTKIVAFLLAVLCLVLALNATQIWLTLILAVICTVFMVVCFCTMYGTRKPDKSPEYNETVYKIKDEVSYPMSVQFFLLKNKFKIIKAILIYKKSYGEDYAHLSVYYVDKNDVVQKQEFNNLKVEYKQGVTDTTVDLDNECVIQPFAESTKF